MNSNPSPLNLSRFEGCTITGALAVSTFVSDAVSIVHGPAGCAHHNVSLLHATLLQHGELPRHNIISSDLGEQDIIFGGEDALEDAIGRAMERDPGAVFVVSTCVTDTIGDDVEAVCARNWGIPVIYLHSSGFLGGSFNDGFVNALTSISTLAEPSASRDAGVNIIGEKNLEFEVEENFAEVSRLLDMLGLSVNIRFVRNIRTADLDRFGRGSLSILREDPGGVLSAWFGQRFGMPVVSGFPVGLSGTLEFIGQVGRAAGVECSDALAEERALQQEIADEFSDLKGTVIALDAFGFQCPDLSMLREVAGLVGMSVGPEGTVIPVPFGLPVGTNGIRHMLRQWRRFIHE